MYIWTYIYIYIVMDTLFRWQRCLRHLQNRDFYRTLILNNPCLNIRPNNLPFIEDYSESFENTCSKNFKAFTYFTYCPPYVR